MIRLYHGSKSGLSGEIDPARGRASCDFGKGFYTGDMPDQPRGLIANWRNNRFYELDCELEGLNVFTFTDDYRGQLDWCMYIAYNRGRLRADRCPALARRYEGYNRNYDVIVGLIANDKMYQVLDEFFALNLCDQALFEALSRVKLGKQYVFKTKRSCQPEHLRIVSSGTLTPSDIKFAKIQEQNRRRQTEQIAEQMKIRYRHASNVRYFDEILEEVNARET